MGVAKLPAQDRSEITGNAIPGAPGTPLFLAGRATERVSGQLAK
jgi:hypothetical protein